jgi:hypothetical protein
MIKQPVIIPSPSNPLGLEDFDMSKFDLEDKKVMPVDNDDFIAGLKRKAENLRSELEGTGNNLTTQLTEVRRMEKEVADTVIILKNYFMDLRRKEEVLLTTINTLTRKRT